MNLQTNVKENNLKKNNILPIYDASDSSVRTFVYNSFLSPEQKLPIASNPSLFLRVDLNGAFYYFAKQKVTHLKDETEILNAVTQTVLHFFGGTNRSNNKEREKIYQNNMPVCPISAFMGKDVSECAERASAAHNLFQFFGLNSYLLHGPILINNNHQIHYYNVVEINKKNYIYDLSVCPTKQTNNGVIKQPLIKELNNLETSILKDEKTNKSFNFETVNFNTASGKAYEVKYGCCEPEKTYFK